MFVPAETHEINLDKYDEPRLHMECLLKTKLVMFDLSLRILLPLESAGIITLADLIRQTPESLLAIQQIGCLSVETLTKLLDRLDLHFGTK